MSVCVEVSCEKNDPTSGHFVLNKIVSELVANLEKDLIIRKGNNRINLEGI